MRRGTKGSRSVGAGFDNENSRPQGRAENCWYVADQVIVVTKQAGTRQAQEHPNSRRNSSGVAHCAVDNAVFLDGRAYDHMIAEILMQKANNKLNDRVVNIYKQTVVEALETRDADHKNVIFEGALRRALDGLLMFILDVSSGIKEIF